MGRQWQAHYKDQSFSKTFQASGDTEGTDVVALLQVLLWLWKEDLSAGDPPDELASQTVQAIEAKIEFMRVDDLD